MADITVKHEEHGEITVALPEGYVTPEQLAEDYTPKAIFQTELGQRATSIIKNEGYVKPDSLLDNEDFRAKALDKWQVKVAPDEAAAAQERADAIETARATWEAQKLTPATQKLDKASARITGLLLRDLHNQITNAADEVGVLESLRKSPVKGQPAPIVHMMAEYFGYHDESDAWAVKKQNEDGTAGFTYATKPETNQPYQGVMEFMTVWSENESNKQFLVDPRQRGPGLQPGGGAERRGGVVQLSYEDSQDAIKYRAAKEKADKMGGEVEITDRPW